MSARLERFDVLSARSGRVVPAVLAATVFAFAMGSSSVASAVRLGGPLRWAMLFALVACSVPYGVRRSGVLSRTYLSVLGALAAVALLSALWSVTPRLTAERAVSFSLLVLAVVFVAAGASRSHEAIEGVFVALLAAADLVAVAGLVVLVVDHKLAVQPQAPTMPERMRGFGENPNTASMLFAIALPIAEWLVVSARALWLRIGAGASCVLLYGSIMASGSRGAMLAAAAGTVLFLALLAGSVRRLVPLEAVAIAFFLGTFQISGGRPSPVPSSVYLAAPVHVSVPAPRPSSGSGGKAGGSSGRSSSGPNSPSAPNAVTPRPWPSTAPVTSRFEIGIKQGLTKADIPIPFVPRNSEVGHPAVYENKPIMSYGSGRVFAWLWAIRQGLEAPLLGYGFGTESTVFVDRLYVFDGSYTENSFVGMFLQLGLIGVILLLLPLLLVARVLPRALGREREDRLIVAAAAAVVLGGFVVAFFQSYLYSVGNVATLTFWTAATIAVIAGGRARTRVAR